MTPQRPPSVGLGILTVMLTLLGWASVPLFLRHFAGFIDAWTSNGWRYGFSALVWGPVLIVVAFRGRGRRHGVAAGRGLPHGLWKAALVPSVVNAAGQVCFTWAHYRIEPGLLTFGLRSQLIFVAIGAWLMFPRERAIIRQPGYLIGVGLLLIGMAGVVVLDDGLRGASAHEGPTAARHSSILKNVGMSSAVDVDDAKTGSAAEPITGSTITTSQTGLATAGSAAAHWQGVALAIASGMLFACYGLAVRKYMHGLNSVIAFAAICQYTALAMVGLMLVLGDRAGWTARTNLSSNQFIVLLISALIGIAFGHMFYYMSIARLGVAVTAGVLQLQPFIVAVGSLALFGEILSGWQWAGGSLAVGGALLMLAVQWRLSARAPAAEEPVAIAEGESGS